VETKDKTELINKALDDNKALEAKLAEKEQEIGRLREHLKIQEREIAALQAELGGKATTNNTGNGTAPGEKHGGTHQGANRQDAIALLRRLGG